MFHSIPFIAKHQTNLKWGTSYQKTVLHSFINIKIMKHKESLGNCSRLKETWQLNVMHDPGLDPGPGWEWGITIKDIIRMTVKS